MPQKFKTYPILIDGSCLKFSLNPAFPVNFTISKNNACGSDPGDKGELYESLVTEVLEKLDTAGSPSRQVLQAFPKDKLVVIVPFDADDINVMGSVCNARAESATELEGCNARVHYTPRVWKQGGACDFSGQNGGAVDDVLLHELIHALRKVNGRSSEVAFSEPPDKLYTDIEEFIAILITNIHMASKGLPTLRKDHQALQPLPAKWATSKGFLDDDQLRMLVQFFYFTERPLCANLAAMPNQKFNPLAAFADYASANGITAGSGLLGLAQLAVAIGA